MDGKLQFIFTITKLYLAASLLHRILEPVTCYLSFAVDAFFEFVY